MDREWSSGLLGENYRGWHWMTIQIKRTQNLVLFSLEPMDESVELEPVGLLVEADGTPVRLEPQEWQLKPTRYWREWPVDWLLSFRGQDYEIKAAFDDQVMDTAIRYWEGVVYVTTVGERVGEGYLELTGY